MNLKIVFEIFLTIWTRVMERNGDFLSYIPLLKCKYCLRHPPKTISDMLLFDLLTPRTNRVITLPQRLFMWSFIAYCNSNSTWDVISKPYHLLQYVTLWLWPSTFWTEKAIGVICKSWRLTSCEVSLIELIHKPFIIMWPWPWTFWPQEGS